MAFTLHWSNTYSQRCPGEEKYRQTMMLENYTDRLFPFTSAVSLQADVLYPNAEAAVSNQSQNGQGLPPPPRVPGCVGNQFDNPFPLESRTPVALPLIMYPTEAEGRDTCALPVLNWEEYMIRTHIAGERYAPSFREILTNKSRVDVKSEAEESQFFSEASEEDANTDEDRPGPSTRISTYQGRKETIPEPTGGDIQRLLIGKGEDLEALEREPRTRKSKIVKIKPPTQLLPHVNKCRSAILSNLVEKYLNAPRLKVKGTWNYFYNRNGACDWIHDKRFPEAKHLFVGNGTKLRMVTLKPSKPTQILSYSVDSVWEEDEIPSNVNSSKPDADDRLSSQIFQIKTLRRRQQIGVRRGKSIELYISDGIPSLVASIPNVGYGFTKYAGLMGRKSEKAKSSPLLTSFDLNPHFPSQLVTMDENGVIQFIDVSEGKVTSQVDVNKTVYHRGEPSGHGPQNFLNDASGLSYAGGHPEVIYYWAESSIHLHDSRTKPVPTHQLFNLRSSVSSLSISDQQLFRTPQNVLNDVISAFTPSGNPLHYYFATTGRIFLMDVRVPRNPVTKFSHGLVSPPAFLDCVKTDHFEVLVGGSQRTAETFCALFDTGHIACLERPDCRKRNPILYSYPRHLSNPREFAAFAHQEESSCAWEADIQRAQDHCHAWTTGLSLMETPKGTRTQSLPPSFIAFTGNTFGDIFMQEWEQKPVELLRKAEAKDERLQSFLCQWRDSMETPLDDPLPSRSPTSLTSDFSLFIHRSAYRMTECKTLRKKPFDPFTPHALVSHRVQAGLPSVEAQIEALCPVKSERLQSLLNVWLDEDNPAFPSAPMEMDLGSTMRDPLEVTLWPGDSVGEGAVEVKEEVDSYEATPEDDITCEIIN